MTTKTECITHSDIHFFLKCLIRYNMNAFRYIRFMLHLTGF